MIYFCVRTAVRLRTEQIGSCGFANPVARASLHLVAGFWRIFRKEKIRLILQKKFIFRESSLSLTRKKQMFFIWLLTEHIKLAHFESQTLSKVWKFFFFSLGHTSKAGEFMNTMTRASPGKIIAFFLWTLKMCYAL